MSSSVLNRVQRMLAEINLNLIFAHGNRPEAFPQALCAGNVYGILGDGQFLPTRSTKNFAAFPRSG